MKFVQLDMKAIYIGGYGLVNFQPRVRPSQVKIPQLGRTDTVYSCVELALTPVPSLASIEIEIEIRLLPSE